MFFGLAVFEITSIFDSTGWSSYLLIRFQRYSIKDFRNSHFLAYSIMPTSCNHVKTAIKFSPQCFLRYRYSFFSSFQIKSFSLLLKWCGYVKRTDLQWNILENLNRQLSNIYPANIMLKLSFWDFIEQIIFGAIISIFCYKKNLLKLNVSVFVVVRSSLFVFKWKEK